MESASEEVVAEEPVVFDREAYYETYEELGTDILSLKIRNNFFQKKMTEYFKKRKVNALQYFVILFYHPFLDGACFARDRPTSRHTEKVFQTIG